MKAKEALFVIDVQKYFTNTEFTRGLPEKIRRYVEEQKEHYPLILFTTFVNTPDSSVYRFLGWKKCMGPPDTDIAPELQPVLQYGTVVSKNALSALKVPRVQELLEEYHIEEIDICGIDTDCCVLATAIDAFDEGYQVHLLRDLSMSHGGKNLHDAALLIFDRNIEPTKL